MWQNYINARTIEEALEVLNQQQENARVIAGGTDLILEMERGVRDNITTIIDITRIPGLSSITSKDQQVTLGPLVTHNHCVASPIIRQKGLPLALASWEVGAPQIRNRSTIAGNLITASPANDTISPLMAMDAQITLRSLNGERIVPLQEFYTGVRKTVMRPDEMLVNITFPALGANQRGTYIKLGLRKAQAISIVHIAVVLTFENEQAARQPQGEMVARAQITLGSVTPIVTRALRAEKFLEGKLFTLENLEIAAKTAQESAAPINDVRSSAAYRMEMVRVCVLRGLRAIFNNSETDHLPENPVLLWGSNPNGIDKTLEGVAPYAFTRVIRARVNGQVVETASGHDKTLLHWLREDVGLVGTKEGCGEGECGACTVFLDGVAVMGCLVPAPRAHGAEIITIEGLADGETLHPVQQAFIDAGAVQCGYCTPGFVMSAAKLLEERRDPSADEFRHAITGNFCRCTGYYKILDAMAKAAGGSK